MSVSKSSSLQIVTGKGPSLALCSRGRCSTASRSARHSPVPRAAHRPSRPALRQHRHRRQPVQAHRPDPRPAKASPTPSLSISSRRSRPAGWCWTQWDRVARTTFRSKAVRSMLRHPLTHFIRCRPERFKVQTRMRKSLARRFPTPRNRPRSSKSRVRLRSSSSWERSSQADRCRNPRCASEMPTD